MPADSNDKGFAMTSSVSCMLLAGYMLCNRDKIEDLAKDIALLARNVATAAQSHATAARKLAEKDFDRIAFLGSGFLKHLAHEASLKMMELTNGTVNGSHESSTGFRHGPKSVIKDKTVTVHMISYDPFSARYDIDLLKEVYGQKKQNTVVAIYGRHAADLPECEKVRIAAEGYGAGGDICTGLEMLVFCQMLAMFKSLDLKVATDDPSPSGEVNRVVKGVTIYDMTR
jgi:tagatose-6-phosphate ketose/aldose isomerase